MISVPQEILDKPFFALTGREVLLLFSVIVEEQTIQQDYTNKKYVYGLNGLAKLLGCGKTNAQKVKNSGVIDEAIYQTGKKIVIDSEKALELLKKNRNN